MYKKGYTCLVVICLCLLLFGCKSNRDILSVIVPYGSPSYATLYLGENDDYRLDVVQGADPLVAAFGSHQYDVIIAPTNLGAKFYQSSKDYILVSSIVWGNYYLLSKTPLSFDDLNHHKIYSFGQNQTPDIILNVILDFYDVTPEITYLSSALEVSTRFIQNPQDVYLMAEPMLSQLEQSLDTCYTLDLQSAYQHVSGFDMYPQASVFVKSSLNDHTLNDIKNDLSEAITWVNDWDNLETIQQLLNSDISIEQLQTSIMRSHLVYKDAIDAKSQIETYFEIILSNNPLLIGNQLPESDFYR